MKEGMETGCLSKQTRNSQHEACYPVVIFGRGWNILSFTILCPPPLCHLAICIIQIYIVPRFHSEIPAFILT